jgi:hypothetical protein
MGHSDSLDRGKVSGPTTTEAQAEDEPTRNLAFGGEDEPTIVGARRTAADGATEPEENEFDDLARTSVMRSDLLQALAARTRDAAQSGLVPVAGVESAPAVAVAPTPAVVVAPTPTVAVAPAPTAVAPTTSARRRRVLLAMTLLASSFGGLGHHELRWHSRPIEAALVAAPPATIAAGMRVAKSEPKPAAGGPGASGAGPARSRGAR